MSYAPLNTKVLGSFREKEFNNLFEYSEAETPLETHIGSEFMIFPHRIYVGPIAESRFAKVLKTVAYVVVDEGQESYVIEKWNLRQHKVFA